jgi:hypothetical protein
LGEFMTRKLIKMQSVFYLEPFDDIFLENPVIVNHVIAVEFFKTVETFP